MKKTYYNTNDTFERQAKRHSKHDKKEKIESYKNEYDENEYDENYTYEDYRRWKTSN